jgi:hypothetical protein
MARARDFQNSREIIIIAWKSVSSMPDEPGDISIESRLSALESKKAEEEMKSIFRETYWLYRMFGTTGAIVAYAMIIFGIGTAYKNIAAAALVGGIALLGFAAVTMWISKDLG